MLNKKKSNTEHVEQIENDCQSEYDRGAISESGTVYLEDHEEQMSDMFCEVSDEEEDDEDGGEYSFARNE